MRMSSMDMSIMRIVYGHGAGLIEHARASPGEEGIMPDNREFIAAVRKEWERFQRGESVNPGVVRSIILRSWERCRAMGLDPDRMARPALTEEAMRALLEEKAELIEVAGNVMQRLYEPISTSRSFISLSDAGGVVLHALWNSAAGYSVPHLALGNVAAESSSGTNAIGICLVEKKPVETRGAEHFCRSLHNWFCSAAPIWHKGRLEGVLNVTLPADSFHHHTRGMMETASYAISEQLRLRELLREQKATLEMLDEGVIVLDDDGRIKVMNGRARSMLGVRRDEDGPEEIRELIFSRDILRAILSENASFRDQEAFLSLRGGSLHCVLSLTRVENGRGRVLTLRGSRRLKEAAARFTGAKAVYTFDHIIGRAPALQEVTRMARLAAQSDVTTLILGESGTGKELFAQAVHNAGSRATAPFVVVNCGALPRELVQSELFGYDEGSFTGASRLGKPGKFELADNGTIFLDEIGEMPLAAQVSLLRLLQNGEVTRVGGKNTRHVNVRVIAATNRNLEEAIRQNAFSEDLFYRLNVFTLNVPPLRERRSDIEMLVRHFLARFAAGAGKPPLRVSGRVMELLMAYDWPGNVRELENTMERMTHMAQDEVLDVDLVPANILAGGQSGMASGRARGLLSLQEKEILLRALRGNGGNLRAAARELGISRSGLYVKLRRFGISPDECRGRMPEDRI